MSTGRRSKSGAAGDETPTEAPSLQELYGRPGFLLRRAHQISVAVFLEETIDTITASQYGALYVLSKVEGLDIIGLGRRLGMDRSTSALVVSKLEAAGWIVMQTNAEDRRRKALRLTDAGRAVLEALSAPAQKARERLLSAFTPKEADDFLTLLEKLVTTFNGAIRTPIVG